jgi:hypothetical protein
VYNSVKEEYPDDSLWTSDRILNIIGRCFDRLHR